MSPSKCPYCERENPLDSKFCNACGAPLYLLPCRNCGAVNEVGATTCHQCRAALPEGNPGGAAASSIEADALDADAKVLATLHELRRRLGKVEAGDTGPPARGLDQGRVTAPAQELAPEMVTAPLTDTPAHYPTPAIAFPAWQSARRTGRVRPATVVIGTAALAAAVVAVLYTLDYRQLGDPSKGPVAAGEVKSEANAAAGNGPANPDAPNGAARVTPAAASLPRVTHGVAKNAAPAPAAAAANSAVPSEGGAPQPAPSAAQRENRVTSVTPAADSLPRVTHGVAKSAAPAPAAANSAVPSEGGAPQPGPSADPRESRATSAAPPASEGVPPRAVEIGSGIERPPPARIGPCTDAMATLGLCKPEPIQRRE